MKSNLSEEKDPLDTLLREGSAYIDDGGFTGRVIQSLPRRRWRFAWRQSFLLGVTIIGSALALFWLPWENLPTLDLPLHSLSFQILFPWILVLVVVSSLIWSIIAALQVED
jgi:hypothetical protein